MTRRHLTTPGHQDELPSGQERSMQDLLFVSTTIVFFAVALAYVAGLERLR
jgi:hypothetical protein